MPTPFRHPDQKTIQSTLRGNILGHVRGPREQIVRFFDRDGGGWGAAYCLLCARPPVPVKNHYKLLAGPTNMTQDVAPKCTLYCFFARGSARMPNKYDQICCSEVYFALFFARESARVAHTYDPRCCPDVYFVLFFDREGGGGGLSWVRVGPRSPGGGGVY